MSFTKFEINKKNTKIMIENANERNVTLNKN